ncbi:MAG: hypothetical protein RBT81_11800 [Gammaproteobacteria bacterium]|jgi:hypothetical protein|nr:hypothetical protein [Gammaproteobacteria bacterium]
MSRLIMFPVLALLAGTAVAEDYLRNKAEVETLLSGATLNGIYLRSQSAYTLEFRADGTLMDKNGAGARWWVNDSGQYCREWLSGRLAGNKACMDLARDGQRITIYSNGKKVAEGELAR